MKQANAISMINKACLYHFRNKSPAKACEAGELYH